jgi:hypothetical protein
MSVTWGRQVIDGKGRDLSGKKIGYPPNMEGFWLCNKFRISAESSSLGWEREPLIFIHLLYLADGFNRTHICKALHFDFIFSQHLIRLW